MATPIDLEQARHVAHLARLRLSDETLQTLTRDLAAILQYVDQIKELDLTGVEPTTHPLPIRNVLRPDDVQLSLSQEAALANAPQAADGFFDVPKVLNQ